MVKICFAEKGIAEGVKVKGMEQKQVANSVSLA